jgi:iron-sulfur cluster assembly protein
MSVVKYKPKAHLSLSEAARARLLTYIKTHDALGMRLSVKKTGCSGLSYAMDYIKEPTEHDISIPFAEGYIIAICKDSLEYLNNMHIDYVKQGLNKKFVFNNPNQTGQCGCGESFTVS